MQTEVEANPLEDHPLACHFPLASQAELVELAESIKTFGQRVAILLFEGKILDGRNRYRACLMASVEPMIDYYRGNEPANVVWALNGPRRNLTTSQKAAMAAIYLPLIKSELEKQVANLPPETTASAPTKSRDLAGEKFGVSGRTVQSAIHVQEVAPQLFDKVKSGEMTVNAAEEKIAEKARAKKEKAAKAKREKEEKSKAHIEQYDAALKRIGEICGPGLLTAIQNGIRLTDRKEVIKFAALDDEQMLQVKPMIDLNWSVSKAINYKLQSLTEGHKLRDLIDRTIIQGNAFSLDIRGGYLHCKFEPHPKPVEI